MNRIFSINKLTVFKDRNLKVIRHWLNKVKYQGGFSEYEGGFGYRLFCRIGKRYFFSYLLLRFLLTRKVSMPFLDVHVTTRCTLNCRDCNHLTPLYRPDTHYTMSLDSFKTNLDKVLKSVDLIYVLQLVGGEPLLHPDLDKMLEYADSKRKVQFILITTNGTLMPPEKLINAVKKSKKTFFVVSDYSHLFLKIMKTEFVLDCLKQNNIRYYIESYSKGKSWFPQWKIHKSNRDMTAVSDEFRKCYLTNCTGGLMNGKIYPCPIAIPIHRIYNHDSSITDLEKQSKNSVRMDLIRFYLKPCFEICDFCHIPDNPIPVDPAIQVQSEKLIN
jgi:MoaA/NifB/PqqE/SkfB family radical SAM enzyme